MTATATATATTVMTGAACNDLVDWIGFLEDDESKTRGG